MYHIEDVMLSSEHCSLSLDSVNSTTWSVVHAIVASTVDCQLRLQHVGRTKSVGVN